MRMPRAASWTAGAIIAGAAAPYIQAGTDAIEYRWDSGVPAWSQLARVI